MFNKIWAWLAAAGAATIAALTIALKYMAGQRNNAREAQRSAEARTATEVATRSAEKRIRESQQAAREQVIEKEKQRDERPKDTRPVGSMRRR